LKFALLLVLAGSVAAFAQDKPAKKPAVRAAAHAKPTPQQIRRFDQLEKKEEQAKSGSSHSKTVRAPSPK
jgi:hypothetical protein